MRNLEDKLQQQCIRWFELSFGFSNRLKIHHSPNGGKRNAIEASKFKAMGVRSGFPDLWVSLGNGKTGFVELKVGKNTLSDNQKVYRDFLISEGYQWALCRSLDDFIRTMTEWGLYTNKKIEEVK